MPARLVSSAVIASPLRGASVIVTRPPGSSAAMAKGVRALGGAPVLLPGVALRATEHPDEMRGALRAATRGEIVVFSSPAAVRFAWALLPALRFARRVCVCAVGAGTARALRARGVSEVLVPSSTQDSSGFSTVSLGKSNGWGSSERARRLRSSTSRSLAGCSHGRSQWRSKAPRRPARVASSRRSRSSSRPAPITR
jgi:uroporphyrinogen-III synthase